ncbi:MAG: hypothetical protein ACRD0J_15860 [Acidimicrobiales bacterium]
MPTASTAPITPELADRLSRVRHPASTPAVLAAAALSDHDPRVRTEARRVRQDRRQEDAGHLG